MQRRVEVLTGWIGWYRFAREKLEYGHEEAVVYANLRTVEELNRRALRARRAAWAAAMGVLVVSLLLIAVLLAGLLVVLVDPDLLRRLVGRLHLDRWQGWRAG